MVLYTMNLWHPPDPKLNAVLWFTATRIVCIQTAPLLNETTAICWTKFCCNSIRPSITAPPKIIWNSIRIGRLHSLRINILDTSTSNAMEGNDSKCFTYITFEALDDKPFVLCDSELFNSCNKECLQTTQDRFKADRQKRRTKGAYMISNSGKLDTWDYHLHSVYRF